MTALIRSRHLTERKLSSSGASSNLPFGDFAADHEIFCSFMPQNMWRNADS
jgi:hypothetical protein